MSTNDGWKRVSSGLSKFNGLKYQRRNREDNGDVGIFEEIHAIMSLKYSVRKSLDSEEDWNIGIRFGTIEECKAFAEKHYFNQNDEMAEKKIEESV